MINPFQNAIWIRGTENRGENIYMTVEEIYDTPVNGGCYRLFIAAHGDYAVFVNESLAAFGQFPDYEECKVYDTHDLTEFFTEGKNRIRLILYCPGRDFFFSRRAKPGIIFELFRDDGSILASTEKTRMMPHPGYRQGAVELLSMQCGFSFIYSEPKARTALPASAPFAIDAEKTMQFDERPIKKLHLSNPLPCRICCVGNFTDTDDCDGLGARMQSAALCFTSWEPGKYLPSMRGFSIDAASGDGICILLDLEKETVGFLTLELELPQEAELLIGWGEHLTDGRIPTCTGNRNFCVSYTGKSGRNTFIHPFLRLGLRYMEIHVYAPHAVLYYAGIRETLYPIDKTVLFRCGDPIHNQIYDVCLRTLRLCMHEHYEDRPWKDPVLYPLGSRVQMLCGYFAFREFKFAYANLKLLALSIREDDFLEVCAPARVPFNIPFFSAVYLLQVYEYLAYSGDTEQTETLLPVLIRIAEAFIRRIDPAYGLIPCFTEKGYWNFYEWQSGLTGTVNTEPIPPDRITYDAPLNAMVSAGLHALSEILLMLRKDADDANRYEKFHLSLNHAMESFFWDEQALCYATYLHEDGKRSHFCELTNALVLYTGASRSKRLAAVLQQFLNPESPLLPVTLSNCIFKYDVLLNRSEKCGKAVFAEIKKIWGGMLTDAADTFYESTEGAYAYDGAGSLCSGCSAIPLYCYLKYALHMLPSMTGLGNCYAFEANVCDTAETLI